MAVDQIAIQSAQRKVTELSTLALTASCRNRATAAAATPTNAYYRVDDGTGSQIRDWTSLTPSSSLSITLAATDNAMRNCLLEVETRIVTVMTDRGLSTQYADSFQYEVTNLPYSS